jgi:hypothetical protein
MPPLALNLFIFGAVSPHLDHFCVDFMCLFHSQKSVSHRTSQQTKGLRQVPSKFFCRFTTGGTPTPYVDPIPPKVTQHDPRLRASAEGRNPKMRKPGMSQVKSLVSHSHTRLCVLSNPLYHHSGLFSNILLALHSTPGIEDVALSRLSSAPLRSSKPSTFSPSRSQKNQRCWKIH